MKINGEYIKANLDKFELLSKSTNLTYRCSLDGNGYIVKLNNQPPDKLSPFWHGIYEMFGTNYAVRTANIAELVKFLANPHILPAEFVTASAEHEYQAFREAEGKMYEPDAFPGAKSVNIQLGRFVGYIHKTRFESYGAYPDAGLPIAGFRDRLLRVMKNLIELHWNADAGVRAYFEYLSGVELPLSSFSLIMPDISGNQFVFSGDLRRINAVVDFDAYVVGPREWELSIIEMCVNDGTYFRKGYEEYQPMPSLKGAREFYRFFCYLCDPGESLDFQRFMTERVCFE